MAADSGLQPVNYNWRLTAIGHDLPLGQAENRADDWLVFDLLPTFRTKRPMVVKQPQQTSIYEREKVPFLSILAFARTRDLPTQSNLDWPYE